MSEKSDRLRVLFVCALNQWRSPTAEHLYRDDSRLQVRSAGVRAQARRRVTESDLVWADIVFVMDREQKQWIGKEFRSLDLPEIRILDVPDEFQYMDPRLQAALRAALDPELAAMIESKELK
ncbi:protein-tyrosine-phosphatase [Horticoccus sp. 23ND18S-11]|uniref:protein-tyrosine-phosphatase n=1 Tax=Horticoccus sp. 23ND18S-11 TaxID=3391832 RepID=UPI0039C8DF25